MSKDPHTMKMAVLQTGRSVDSARATHGDYDDMCKALMGRTPDEADSFEILEGVFPDSIDPYDVFLVTGSKFGVYEDHSWIAPLEELIRNVFATDKKLIGICFGHQIIARALGGDVGKSDRGFGVGAMGYTIKNADGTTRDISLYAWHQDQVLAPPPGAEVIAQSDFCEYAGLRYGDKAITVQPHPEFTKEYMRDLAEARRGVVISDELADAAIQSLSQEVDQAYIRDMFLSFISK